MLADSEIQTPSHIYMHAAFNKNISERFEYDTTPDNFPDIIMEDIPSYDLYEEDSGNGM